MTCLPIIFIGCEDTSPHINSDWEVSKDYKYSLTVDKTSIELGALDTQSEFTFQSNGTLAVSSDASWCRPMVNGNQINVALDINSELSTRKATLTLQLTEDATVNKQVLISQESNTVDLGLPSGTLWATYNVGSKKPEDYGEYFYFGETKEREVHDYSGPLTDARILFDTIYKYSWDEITVLKDEYDAANVNWGDSWNIPSTFEFLELKDYCTFSPETMNGVVGTRITGLNGNSIFMPLAGFYAGSTYHTKNKEKTAGGYHSCDNRSVIFAYEDSLELLFVIIPSQSNAGCTIRPVQKPITEIFPISATINCDKPVMSVGDTQTLTVNFNPTNTTYKSKSFNYWSTSNSRVVTIDQYSGTVTAIDTGTVTINYQYLLLLEEVCPTSYVIKVQ